MKIDHLGIIITYNINININFFFKYCCQRKEIIKTPLINYEKFDSKKKINQKGMTAQFLIPIKESNVGHYLDKGNFEWTNSLVITKLSLICKK
jgi:hypothetical protein